MYSDIGPAIDATVRCVFILFVTTVPLAIWKLVDIALWVYSHLEVGWR
jgi:hypothetical protein